MTDGDIQGGGVRGNDLSNTTSFITEHQIGICHMFISTGNHEKKRMGGEIFCGGL
jgi:hypothetical protein